MESMKQYFISITTCAILCAIVTGISGKDNVSSKIVKMLCGLFLTFTLIRPVTEIRFDEFTYYSHTFSENTQAVIAAGEDYRINQLSAIIKEETEAYILDKAQALNCTLDVEVIVEKSDQPVPTEVYITGNLSHSAKETLRQVIEEDLHIAKENQIWIQ